MSDRFSLLCDRLHDRFGCYNVTRVYPLDLSYNTMVFEWRAIYRECRCRGDLYGSLRIIRDDSGAPIRCDFTCSGCLFKWDSPGTLEFVRDLEGYPQKVVEWSVWSDPDDDSEEMP